MLATPPEDLDPDVALRLALAAKRPMGLEWRTAVAMDLELDAGDIAKRILELPVLAPKCFPTMGWQQLGSDAKDQRS